LGNLIYRKTAQNFNSLMATARPITIAEVEELVEPGSLDPNHVVTPGIYVHRIVPGSDMRKKLQRRNRAPEASVDSCFE